MKLLVKLCGALFAIISCISLIKFFSNLIENHLFSALWYLIIMLFCVSVLYQAIKIVKEINQKEYQEYQELLKNHSKPPLPPDVDKNSNDSAVALSTVKETSPNDILSDIPPFLRDSVNLNVKKEVALTKAEASEKTVANSVLEEFVSVDVETTGLDPEDDRIIEISETKFTNEKTSNESSFSVNTDKLIPYEATKINKITVELPKVETLQVESFDKAAANVALGEFVSVDVETTGLDPEDDRIIEISAVKFTNGEISDEFSSLVNPRKPIPPEATKINKITDDMVAEAPDTYEIMKKFIDFIGKSILVAHNAKFDMDFISRALTETKINAKIYYFDTLQISRNLLKKKVKNHKLNTIAKYFDIINEDSHRAASDAKVCGEIFIKFGTAFTVSYNKSEFDSIIKLIGSTSNQIQDNILFSEVGDEVEISYNRKKEKYEVSAYSTLGYIPKNKENLFNNRQNVYVAQITEIDTNNNDKLYVEIGIKLIDI